VSIGLDCPWSPYESAKARDSCSPCAASHGNAYRLDPEHVGAVFMRMPAMRTRFTRLRIPPYGLAMLCISVSMAGSHMDYGNDAPSAPVWPPSQRRFLQ